MSLYDNRANCATMGTIIDFSTLTSRNPHRENEGNGNNDYNNNYYPGARACVRVREEMDGMKELYDLYMDAFQRDRVAAIVRREMAQAIEAGADPSLIVYAIELSEIAPTPSWAYARAVIRKCMSDGCRTYEDCAERAQRVRAQSKKSDYQERKINTEDQFYGFNSFLERGTDK